MFRSLESIPTTSSCPAPPRWTPPQPAPDGGDGGERPLTWERLAALEPRLQQLLTEVRSLDPTTTDYCVMAVFGGWPPFRGRGIKARLSALVGWSRTAPTTHDVLLSSAAFDVAHSRLLDSMPSCRCCGGA